MKKAEIWEREGDVYKFAEIGEWAQGLHVRHVTSKVGYWDRSRTTGGGNCH